MKSAVERILLWQFLVAHNSHILWQKQIQNSKYVLIRIFGNNCLNLRKYGKFVSKQMRNL